jgi:hypothetical protein
MALIMIALVSDQRMQNIIPIFQEGIAYDELILVLSKERGTGQPHPRYKKAVSDLVAVLNSRLKVRSSEDWVDPYNIEDVVATISSLVNKYDHSDRVLVNISGGTKPMAIGALRATHNNGATCLYTNTEDEEILKLSPDGSIERENIRIAGLDVPLYIRAYGEEVTDSKKVEDISEKEKTWARTIGDQHAIIYQKIIVPVMSAIKIAQRCKSGFPITCKVTPTRRQREVINQLAQMELWLWHKDSGEILVTDSLSSTFLNGTWVEVFVAMQMHQSNYFDDVRLNIKLRGVEGEIDVAAISNGKLALIECKSNVQQSQQLSKLDSLRRRLGGPYAQAYYARASEAYANRIQNQCRKFQLNGEFFGAELKSIGEKIGKKMRSIS